MSRVDKQLIQSQQIAIKKLEKERDLLKTAVQEQLRNTSMAIVSRDDYQAGFEEGWVQGYNKLAMIVAENYEPLMDAYSSIESLIGTLRGYVLAGEQTKTLDSLKPLAELLALTIGQWLNYADAHQRALKAALGGSGDFIDFSIAQAIRDAAFNFKNNLDPTGERLVELLKYGNPQTSEDYQLAQRVTSLASAMKPTRERPKVAPRDEIGRAVQHLVDEGTDPGEAIGKVYLELCTGSGRKYKFKPKTVKAYYYEWRRAQSVVVN